MSMLCHSVVTHHVHDSRQQLYRWSHLYQHHRTGKINIVIVIISYIACRCHSHGNSCTGGQICINTCEIRLSSKYNYVVIIICSHGLMTCLVKESTLLAFFTWNLLDVLSKFVFRFIDSLIADTQHPWASCSHLRICLTALVGLAKDELL